MYLDEFNAGVCGLVNGQYSAKRGTPCFLIVKGGVVYQLVVSLGVSPNGFNVPVFGLGESDAIWFCLCVEEGL